MPRPFATLINRDRLILGAGLLAITALAWACMIREAQAMTFTGICCCAGMKMSGPDFQSWAPSSLVPLSLMWSEMMVAMMLPSAAPMILTFAAVNRKRRAHDQPFVPTLIFVLGYLAVWTGFSILAGIFQWALHGFALLSPMMVSSSQWLAAGILISAGLFQWTPLKNSCLGRCRSPLQFLLTDWREGYRGALRMGVKHGAYCTGCCWVLMCLLFVAGVMNMWWVAALTLFVLLEKMLPRVLWFGRASGALLIAWGLARLPLVS